MTYFTAPLLSTRFFIGTSSGALRGVMIFAPPSLCLLPSLRDTPPTFAVSASHPSSNSEVTAYFDHRQIGAPHALASINQRTRRQGRAAFAGGVVQRRATGAPCQRDGGDTSAHL